MPPVPPPGRPLARVCSSPRLRRLFLCGLARHVPGALDAPDALAAVGAAEGYADGRCGLAELGPAYDAAVAARLAARDALLAPWRAAGCRRPLSAHEADYPAEHARHAAAALVACCARPHFPEGEGAARLAEFVAWRLEGCFPGLPVAELLEDLAGPPGRGGPPVVGADALRVAWECYERGDWPALGVVADALEDGGCAEGELLGHLRGPGPHWRGCWALDRVLGMRRAAAGRRRGC